MSAAPWPAYYEIRVDRVLDSRWEDWFAGLHIDIDGDQTTLSGMLEDQPALHGVLDQIRNLGLSIIAVCRQPPSNAP
jgi:hypothetical protein